MYVADSTVEISRVVEFPRFLHVKRNYRNLTSEGLW